MSICGRWVLDNMEFYSAKYKIQKYINGEWVDYSVGKGRIIVIAESHDLAVAKVDMMLDSMSNSKDKFRAVLNGTVKKCIGVKTFESESNMSIRPFYY